MKRIKAILLLAGALPLCGFKFLSQLENEKGNALYKKGQFIKAKNEYAGALKGDTSSPEIAYNLGNAFFRGESFKEAQSNYQKSTASKSGDAPFKAKAFYNLGNSYYRQKDFKNAAESYKNSLRMNPKDEDAKYNLELVLKKLDKDKKDKKDQKKEDEKEKTKQKPNLPSNKDPEKQTEGNKPGDKDGQGGDGGQKDKPKPEEGQSGEEKKEEEGPSESKKDSGEEGTQPGEPAKPAEEMGQKQEESQKEGEDSGKSQPKSDAQLRAEQLLGALENQEQQVLKFQNTQNAPQGRVKRVSEQDW